MISEADATRWYELLQDSDEDVPAYTTGLSETSLKTVNNRTSSDCNQTSAETRTSNKTCTDPALSQYSLEETNCEGRQDMDFTEADVECSSLQFKPLPLDESRGGKSAECSTASKRKGYAVSEKSVSSLSGCPVEALELPLDDVGNSGTEDSSACEEFLNTAISEVSKDFITGNLSSYNLQSEESDVSTDDQKVHHRFMGGRYPETAIGMSDSDWNVTESDNNTSPRTERHRTETTMSSLSAFSPPLSSTILTNQSTVSAGHRPGLSIIQEASVENTSSFKEIPEDVTSTSISRYSFLGRDHNKYLTSPDLKRRADFSRFGAALTSGLSSTHQLNSSLVPDSKITPELSMSRIPDREENQIRDKSYSSGVSSFESRSDETSSLTNVSFEPSVTYRLDNLPSTIDLAKRSELILYRTLSKLKGRDTEGRHSLPFPSSGTLENDTNKRHSFGQFERRMFSDNRSNYLASRSSISNPTEHSVRLEKARYAGSDTSGFMARELSSGATVLSKDDCDSGMTRELEESKGHRLFPSRDMSTQAAGNGRKSENWNRSANNSVEQPEYRDVEDRLPPPPMPEECGVPSEEPFPPPPSEDECSASIDYRKLQEDLQEIQNSLHNNLDFADSGNESESEKVFAKEEMRNDLEVSRPVQTPVSSENDSEIIPSNTTTPERSRHPQYGLGVNLGRRDFTSRELDALGTHSQMQRQSYVDRAQVAENAARRQRYNSEGEETHTSGSSNTRGEEVAQPDRIDEVRDEIGRNDDESRGRAGCRGGMSDSVSMILQRQDPQKQVSGILNEVQAREEEMLTQLSNRPKAESSFSDMSANVSNRSLILTENDVRKKLEMSGLSSPDRSKAYLNASLSEFATPRKVGGPFSALSSAQDFLSHQLEEMSNKTFNHSIELRSPLQRQMYQVYPVYGFNKGEEEKNAASSSYVSTTERQEELLVPDTAGRLPVETCLPDEISSRLELVPDAVQGAESTHSMTDRRFASSVTRLPVEPRLPDEISARLELVPDAVQGAESTHSMTDRRFASSVTRVASDHDMPVDRGYELEKSGSEVSNPQPTSEKQSSTFGRNVSPTEFEQSSGMQKDRLRPYRPAGSRELYYTESDTGSLPESVTTMESTHTGSDDAVAPYFPPHILGSRQDGPPPVPRKVPTQGLASEHALSTIEEKSISEEKGRPSFDSSLTRQEGNGLKQEETNYREKPRNVPQLSQYDEGESGIGTRSNFSSYEHSERNRVSHTQEQLTERATDSFPQETYPQGRMLDKPYASSRPSDQSQFSRSETPPKSGGSYDPQIGRSEREGQALTMSLQTSPIQPSRRGESQLEVDPRHSTAVDTSSYERSPLFSGHTESVHYSVPSQTLEAQEEWREEGSSKGSSQKSGKENRSRSAEKKESRQRIEHKRNVRRGDLPNSSSEDDSNRTIDQAPVSRPAQLLREALEQELDTEIPADIDNLWRRFQELNKTDSDTSLNTSRMETLSHLLRNPAKHLVTSYFEDKERQRRLEEDRAGQDRERRRKEKQIEKDAQHVNVSNKGRTSEGKKRSSKRSLKSREDPESESLYAIPEDTSFSNKQPKGLSLTDPNMQKLREKIERQKEKINRERRKELKRMEKLIKLEQLLSAKKTGKISESTLTDQLESISTTSVPTDSTTDEVTDSTLTVSGTSSCTLTDETTTAKDSSIEMQLVKYARGRDESASYSQSPSERLHSREIRQSRNRKVEKARANEKLKEREKNAEKAHRRGKPSEEEALYDYKNVHIEIVDKPERKRLSPSRTRGRSTMQDAATNYPSPVNNSQYSPQSYRKQKQRRTRSEGVQTSPKWRHRPKSRSPSPSIRDDQGVISVPFGLQEKMSRSQSPPYSRRFTPESLANQLPKQKQKLPVSPKGIAWYIDAKDTKPWRQPLKERQAFALKQAWVPESELFWQKQDDVDGNEENMREKRLTDAEKVREISRLLTETSSQDKPASLQEAFRKKMYKFISKSRERQKRMALAAEHRRMQDALRQERERLFGDTRKTETNPNVHPYSENLLRPKKRVFTRQEQKDMTQKFFSTRIYQRLPEVVKREQDKQKENQYKLNRLKARVFNKRVQRRVLMKAQVY